MNKRLAFFLPFRRQIVLLAAGGIVSSVFSALLLPYLSKLLIDNSFLKKDLHEFLRLSIAGSLVFVCGVAARSFYDLFKRKALTRTKMRLAGDFVRKLFSHDLSFFQAGSAGQNMYQLGDIDTVSRLIIERIPSAMTDAVICVAIFSCAFILERRMALLLGVLSPLFFLKSVYIRKGTMKVYGELWQCNSLFVKRTYEALSRMQIIKVFGLEGWQRRRYLRGLIENIRLEVRSLRLITVNSLASAFLSKAVYGAMSLYGGWLIIRGEISFGTYAAAMLYLTQLGMLLQSVSGSLENAAQEVIALERFCAVIEKEPVIRDAPLAVEARRLQSHIRVSRVTFGYRKERPVFKGLDLTIRAGTWAGVVGASGCGKTTLGSLIARLFDPWEGAVLFDDIPLTRLRLKSLRERVAVALQEPLLFDLSFYENIAVGMHGVTRRQVEGVARTVALHDFVARLPDGYDTLIGENACKLSQGYKQRVALARAVVRRADILIIDEATSSIDSATEEKIFRALRRERKGLTTIVISHRLFSVRDAERIFLIRTDGVIEEGTHDELARTSVAYRELFSNQMEGCSV